MTISSDWSLLQGDQLCQWGPIPGASMQRINKGCRCQMLSGKLSAPGPEREGRCFPKSVRLELR